MNEFVKDLGIRLRNARAAHNIKSRDFHEMGISSSTICRVEQGKPVDYETGKKLEKWLSEIKEPKLCDRCNGTGFIL